MDLTPDPEIAGGSQGDLKVPTRRAERGSGARNEMLRSVATRPNCGFRTRELVDVGKMAQSRWKFGVNKYREVNPKRRAIEAYRLQESALQLSATFAESEDLTLSSLPGFNRPVRPIFNLGLPGRVSKRSH